MSLTFIRKGKEIYLEALFPLVPQGVEYEIQSDRNYTISRMSDVSPRDPDRTPGPDRYPEDVDTWFPVVDVALVPGMYAKVSLSDDYRGEFYFNSYMNPEPIRTEGQRGIIEGKWLTHWENGLYLLSKTAGVTKFALYLEAPALPTVSRKQNVLVKTLTEDWGGTIRAWYSGGDGEKHLLGEIGIPRPEGLAKREAPKGAATYREALNLCLGYILRSQNRSPGPHGGGLFLFYDLDAGMYRNGQWPWSWGTAIKFLLEAARLDPALLDYPAEELREATWRIGNTSLQFQVINPGHPAHYFGTTRYTVRTFEKTGYQELVNTGSDAGFLAGWGWIPLYRETGDKRFLDAAKNYIDALVPVLDNYKVPPQEWLPAKNGWTDFTIDESGFGTEGINAYFQAAGDPVYRDYCRRYMEKHLAVFEREDGLWDRQYTFSTGKIDPTQNMVRGLGWAMEGLLAAYRCTGDTPYLEKALKMARVLISRQREDGSWTFKFDQSVQAAGTADKGTSLWGLLLYMLYRECHDDGILAAARRALGWCMNNQYTGPDPHARGGIVGVSGESGITYRPWFRMCCQYTSAFFGLALLEEMKLPVAGA